MNRATVTAAKRLGGAVRAARENAQILRGKQVERKLRGLEVGRGNSPSTSKGRGYRIAILAASNETGSFRPSTLAGVHVAANADAIRKQLPAPYAYARGTYQRDAADKRPRSVRRQSYRVAAVSEVAT
jgi:hypothetical protein